MVDTTANVSENECAALGAEPGAVDNTAADVFEKCHADCRAKSDVVVDSAVTSASEISTLFAKLILIVLQLPLGSNVLLADTSAILVIETSLMMLLIAYLRMGAISSLNQQS